MAVWTILRAMDAMEALPLRYRLDPLETLGLDARELDLWEDVSRRMYVPFHNRVISQFEGYNELQELDWHAYRHRHDRIAAQPVVGGQHRLAHDIGDSQRRDITDVGVCVHDLAFRESTTNDSG
jgi:trehalose/maltose hydrolase-like predicted phosphorylase